MSKKKKVFATSAAAVLAASAVTPAVTFAAEKTFPDLPSNEEMAAAISNLVESGVITGYEDGTFRPDNQVTRAESAKILYSALDLPVKGTENYTDVETNDWFYKAVVATTYAGIFEGYDGKFNPDDNLTREQAAKILVEAFNLEGSADLSFEDADDISDWAMDYIETAYANGIIKGREGNVFDPQASITRAEFAVMVKRAMDVVATPEVESVVAVNAKTIEVNFNKAIDKDTLKDSTKKDVITVVQGKNAHDPGTITQELSEDGKTLTLKASDYFKGDYTVKVPFEVVKDTTGKFVSPVNKTVTVNDTTAPVLLSATSTIKDVKDGLTKIVLTFDEEVSSIDTVKINGKNYTATPEGNKATVNVDKLDATKEYKVQAVNVTDAAGNLKDVQEVVLNVVIDNVAPSVSSITPVGENKVKVAVDKALKDNNLSITAKVGTFNVDIVTDVQVNAKNNKEYFVTLNSAYLFKNGNTDTVKFTVKKEQLVDELGNKNASDIVKEVVLEKDVTAPSVTKVETKATEGKVTSFTVTYDEEVTLSSNPLSLVTVVNSKGEILSVGDVVSKVELSNDSKSVVFTLKEKLNDKYTFDLAKGFVQDKALEANKSGKYSFTVNVTEKEEPAKTTFEIAGAGNVSGIDNVLYVDFGVKVKATGTGSALNPSAYQINGVALPSDTKIEFGKDEEGNIDQTTVIITLPEGFVKDNDDKAIFRVTGVKDLDNKVNEQFSELVEIKDNTAPVVKSFVATDLDELTVTYSEAIKLTDDANYTDITDEIKLVDSKGNSVAITGVTVEDGKLVLTVEDATKVKSLTTLEVDEADQDIFDLNGNAQKAKVTITK